MRRWDIGMKSLTCKARAIDVLHTVVRDEELLLPAHKHCAAIERILHRQVRLLELVLDVPERGEPRPVHHILLLVCSPVPRQETIPAANNLGVEVGRQFGPVVGKTTDAQVPAQARRGEVDVLLTNSL